MEIPQPVSFDIEAWINAGLKDSAEVHRLLCLQELLDGGFFASSQPILEKMAAEDRSDKCRKQAELVLKAERTKKEACSQLESTHLNPKSFHHLVEDMEGHFTRAVMDSMRTAPHPTVLDEWREILVTDCTPEIQSSGLWLLARFGVPEDIRFGQGLDSSPHPIVLHSLIELYEHLQPDQLPNVLKTILAKDDLSLHFHAINSLRLSDPPAALLFLQPFLSSGDPFLRQRALRELVLFPFELVLKEILKFVSAEKHPLLLIMGGAMIVSNPHPQAPLHIYDIGFSSSAVKKEIMQFILREALECIHQAGILKQDIQAYMEDLKVKLRQRKAALTRKVFLGDLDNPDAVVRLNAIRKLKDGDDEEVPARFRQRLSIEADPVVLDLLKECLGEPGQAPKPEETAETFDKEGSLDEISPDSFFDMPLDEQKAVLASFSSLELFQKRAEVIKSVFSADFSPEIQKMAFEILARFGGEPEVAFLSERLKSLDSGSIPLGLRTLTKLDKDKAVPILQEYLNDNVLPIQETALDLLLPLDKETALDALYFMSRSPRPEVLQSLITLVPQLDELSAEPILISLFNRTDVSTVRMRAAELLAESPSLESLQCLYDEVQGGGASGEALKGVWNRALANAVPELAPDAIALEKLLEKKLQKRRETEKKFAPIKKVTPRGAGPSAPVALFSPTILGLAGIALIFILGLIVHFQTPKPTLSVPASTVKTRPPVRKPTPVVPVLSQKSLKKLPPQFRTQMLPKIQEKQKEIAISYRDYLKKVGKD